MATGSGGTHLRHDGDTGVAMAKLLFTGLRRSDAHGCREGQMLLANERVGTRPSEA